MKKFILPLLFFSFTISSCCKEEACIEVKGVPITFLGYKWADLDTIYVTGYEKGTNFGKVSRKQQRDTVQRGYGADSALALKVTNGGIAVNGLQSAALPDTDEWEIYIPASWQTIRISNYGYQYYQCQSCGKSDGKKIASLSTCYLDGTPVKIDAVRVYK